MFRPFGFPAPKTFDLFGFLFKKNLRVHVECYSKNASFDIHVFIGYLVLAYLLPKILSYLAFLLFRLEA
jgi:hypothetical protein